MKKNDKNEVLQSVRARILSGCSIHIYVRLIYLYVAWIYIYAACINIYATYLRTVIFVPQNITSMPPIIIWSRKKISHSPPRAFINLISRAYIVNRGRSSERKVSHALSQEFSQNKTRRLSKFSFIFNFRSKNRESA